MNSASEAGRMAEGQDGLDELRGLTTFRAPAGELLRGGDSTPVSPGPAPGDEPSSETSCTLKASETSGAPSPPSAGLSGSFQEISPMVGRLQPGQVIFGKYEVIRLLGQGGMGTVWLVRHRELNQERALKMIVAGISHDPEALARLKREAQALALFSHPNAVAVHDARISDDAAFIEMEYVRGQCLSAILVPGVPMPLDWTARILKQLCDVLQVAHERLIVHRDLKPSNLMLADGQPPGQELLKVLDFGIAKILNVESTEVDDLRTQPGVFIGTIPYMSPDQAASGPIDRRSDLYSVGILLYEFLTGYRPFAGGLSGVNEHLNTPPPPFKSKNRRARVPKAVEKVVLRCLAKRPEDRPQTAAELAEEFLKAARPWWQRHRTLSSTIGVVAIAAVALAVVTALPKDRSTGTPPNPLVIPGPKGVDPPHPAPAPEPPEGYTWDVSNSGNRSTNLVRRSDNVSFYLLREGVYLPEGYTPIESVDRVNGMPGMIERESDGTRFIRIAGGQYLQGDFRPGQHNDTPHQVKVSDFYIQETEVTNAEIQACSKQPNDVNLQVWKSYFATLSKSPDDEATALHSPAACITRLSAQRYAQSVRGRLPTEAEWEYAARSGGRKRIWATPDALGEKLKACLAGAGSSEEPGPAPAGTFSISHQGDDQTDQGVLDMTGNVREWCLDMYKPYDEIIKSASQPLINPREGQEPPSEGSSQEYVVRGGSFELYADDAMTFKRDKVAANEAPSDLGFRVVIDCPPIRKSP